MSQHININIESIKQSKMYDYKADLLLKVQADRSTLKEFIEERMQVKADQETLRRLSWTAVSLNLKPPSVLDLPLHAASSRQQAYHLMHFSHSVLLAVERPELREFCVSQVQVRAAWILVEEDELFRLEQQHVLFNTLVDAVSSAGSFSTSASQTKTKTDIRLKDIYDLLLEIKERVEQRG